MKKAIIIDFIRFVFLVIIVSGVLYAVYPIIRYEYVKTDSSFLKIDKITGTVSKLDVEGWKVINE